MREPSIEFETQNVLDLPHVMRYHKDLKEHRVAPTDAEPFPFTRESFRCVVNRPDSIK